MDGIKDVRAMGAIGVVEVENSDGLTALRARFVEENVWIRPFGNIVYLMPPFVVDETERTALTDAVVKIVGEWSGR